MEAFGGSAAGALGRCAQHGDRPAVAACDRCGAYVCAACRRHYDYRPLCSTCLPLRSHGGPRSGRAVAAVVLAGVGLVLPILPLGPLGAFLGHLELGAIARGEAPFGGRGFARAAVLFGWAGGLFFLLLALAAAAAVAGALLEASAAP